MNELVRVAMLATLAAIAAQLVFGGADPWVGWASLALTGSAAMLAVVRTVPNAARLGRRNDPLEDQVRLSRAIAHDHMVCFTAIASVLTLQLGFGIG